MRPAGSSPRLPTRATTLRDVAELAGVDRSTVSRALRGDETLAARPETRQRILDAARRLDYRPNALARSLRHGRTDVIALVTPGVDNIGFTGVIHGVQQEAARLGRLVLLADAAALDQDADLYYRLALEGRVDGLLAAFGTVRDPMVRGLAGRGVPVVAVNRQVAGIEAAVVVDDEAGAALAVDHLVASGHRHIGQICGPGDFDTSRRRISGFRQAMARHGLPVRRRWLVDGGYTEAGGREAAGTLVAQPDPPSAVFAANLVSALGALGEFKRRGLTVPGDISIVTMDEHAVAGHTDPPLTTVSMPLAEMGEQATRLVVDMAEGGPPRKVVVGSGPRLVERDSVSRPG